MSARLALLAAIAVLLAVGAWAWPVQRLDLALEGDGTVVQPTDHVRLGVTGEGRLDGAADALHIRWQAGRLEVEVDPDEGVDLRVSFEEGEVQVVGTAFVVDRNALGTSVLVKRGKVLVRCGKERAFVLTPGGPHVCLPVTASGFLLRARVLQRERAASRLVLDAVEKGFSLEPQRNVLDELVATRIAERLRMGDIEAARAEAEGVVARGGAPRHAELLRLLATIAYRTEGCEAAGRWLAQGAVAPDITAACAD